MCVRKCEEYDSMWSDTLEEFTRVWLSFLHADCWSSSALISSATHSLRLVTILFAAHIHVHITMRYNNSQNMHSLSCTHINTNTLTFMPSVFNHSLFPHSPPCSFSLFPSAAILYNSQQHHLSPSFSLSHNTNIQQQKHHQTTTTTTLYRQFHMLSCYICG